MKFSNIGDDIVEDLKLSLLSRSNSYIDAIEPEEEPVLEAPINKLSEVLEDPDDSKKSQKSFTSYELDSEDELCDENGKGLDFNPAVSLILRSFVPLPTKHERRTNFDLKFED